MAFNSATGADCPRISGYRRSGRSVHPAYPCTRRPSRWRKFSYTHPVSLILDISVWDKRVDIAVHNGLERLPLPPVRPSGDGCLIEHLAVEVVSDRLHVSVLLRTGGIFPAPRISRSRIAILMPEPSSVNSRIAWRRFSASSFNILSRLYMRNAYEVRFERPIRPRIW